MESGRAEMSKGNSIETRALLVAVAGMALLVILTNLSMSLLHGHLAMLPSYDDVNYMADALVRLRFGSNDGLRSIVRSFLADPPHAPVTTLTGIIGFSLLGPEPIAAYIANAWVVIAFFVFATWLSRPIGDWPDRALFIGTFCFVPVVHAMVMEFRPDLPGGLLLGIAAYLVVTTDVAAASHRRRVGLALLCVAATITKPTGFIIVVPALAFAALTMLAGQLLLQRRQIRETLLGTGEVLAIYLLVMLPFAIVWGPETTKYVYGVLFTYADVWATDGDRSFHFLYHSLGIGGLLGLGNFFRNGLALIIVDLVLMAVSRQHRNWRAAGYYLVVTAIYVAMAMSGEKTPYQGSFFYIPFVIAFAAASVRIIVLARESVIAWMIRPTLVVILAIYAYQLPLASYYYGATPNALKLPPILHAITEHLVEIKEANLDNPLCTKRPLKMVFTDSLPIPTELVRFEAARNGVEVEISTTFMARSLHEAEVNADEGDLVLIADPSHQTISRWLPGMAFNWPLHDYLMAKPGIARFDVGNDDGKPQWLVVQRHCNPAGKL